jgi:hypothetical protein
LIRANWSLIKALIGLIYNIPIVVAGVSCNNVKTIKNAASVFPAGVAAATSK